MKKVFLSIVLLVGLMLQTKSQTLTPEQLQADFDLFRKALHEVHPQPYLYTSKSTFDSLFTATRARLNQPMSQQGFYTSMTPLIAALHDGHMKWIVSGKDQHYPFFTDQLFPLQLYFTGKKAWISGNYGSTEVPLGAEVLSIDGKPVSDIIEQLLPNITFADGFTMQGKYEELNHFFSGYYATYITASPTYEVIFQDGIVQKTITLPAVTEEMVKTYTEKNKPASQPPFRLTYPSSNTAILTIERFWSGKNEPDYSKFLKETFRQIEEKQIQHLVLDIRNNEGGEEKYGIELYEYLAKQSFHYYDHIKVARKEKISFAAWRPGIYDKLLRKLLVKKTANGYVFNYPKALKTTTSKRNAYKGDLLILVNGNSFSVTTEFSARVHADKRATFIGQETAGGYRTNSSGLFTIVQLPNSKIDLGIPMFGFQMANVPAEIQHGQGIVPDYIVTPAIEDIIKKRDKVMEYTLQLIGSKAAVLPASK
ncbi:peptidase S41 [Rhodocytophaga rosea]|uniref:Peptidase S41 n=1 Tax=Rhodocytophaga rosea TaxID=2704465 RepID=A0A6C0GDM9_9BACT|nr:S41 family peptidase [Rhodocytophaga rosea]QHT65872.1 peptidase S41 [Rhodocytophaga rosea]